MIVYVVITTVGVWNEFDNFAIFSNREKAECYMQAHKQNMDEDKGDCYLHEREVN